MAEVKVWFVTGSSAGLGRAVVEYALSRGDKVVATCRKPSDLDDLVGQHPKTQLATVRLDVTKPPEITSAFERAIAEFGRVDVVYNNAGILIPIGEIESVPDEYARSIFEINFWGAANVSREAVRVFRDVNTPPGGRLLQASSSAAIRSSAGVAYYCATSVLKKYALEGLSEGLQSEMHPSWNIKITILQLGGFATRLFSPESFNFLPETAAYSQPDSGMRRTRDAFKPGGPIIANLADAHKAAREIYKIAGSSNVGLRVSIGQDSLTMAIDKLKDLQETIDNSKPFCTDLQF